MTKEIVITEEIVIEVTKEANQDFKDDKIQDFPEWKTVKKRLGDLVPYEHNPRTISVHMFEKLKESIQRDGYAELIAVNDDNTIIAGHQRVRAFYALGMQDDDEIEVRVPDYHMTPKAFKRYLLSSNKIDGDWDWDLLASMYEMDEMLEAGFTDEEMHLSFPEEVESPEPSDEAPELPIEPKTKLGDVYELNGHRLICGSSTDAHIVENLFQGRSVDMLLTDPPYGIDYGKKNKYLNKLDGRKRKETDIKNDLDLNYRQFFSEFLSLIPWAEYNTAYIFMSSQELHNLRLAIEDCGMKWGEYLVWLKNNLVLGRKDYHSKHEFCLYAWKGKHKFYGDRTRTAILEFNKPHKSDLHPTMKPIDLLCQVMEDGSKKGSLVYDAFTGSGSTLMACEQLGRNFCGIELSPAYCDVIVTRWKEHMQKHSLGYSIRLNGKEIDW